jgi:hypothetical protein
MLTVAERFDRERASPDCGCLSPPFPYDAFDTHPVGTDHAGGRFADVSVAACRICSREFLHYAWEIEGISRSGRWARAPLPLLHPRPSASEAPHVLSLAPFHYVGGSYFASMGTLQPRPLDPRTAF